MKALEVRSLDDLKAYGKDLRPSQITETLAYTSIALIIVGVIGLVLFFLFYVLPFTMTGQHTATYISGRHPLATYSVTTHHRVLPGRDAVIFDAIVGWVVFTGGMLGLTSFLKKREGRRRY